MNHVEHYSERLSQAVKWARQVLESCGNTLKSTAPEMIQHTPWSSVAKFETSQGDVYLKQTPPDISREPEIIQCLKEKCHASVPEVIASSEDLHCFLMKNAGSSLREILKTNFNESLIFYAIDQFTQLQKNASDHIDELLKTGVPDWRLDKLPALYQQVLDDRDLLMADGLSQSEIEKCEALVPRIRQLCEELSTYQIKETIVQPDFNDNNVLIDLKSQKIKNIDLGEIAISHPYFSLINFTFVINKHHNLSDDLSARIKDRCFSAFVNDEDVIALAEKLFFVYDILGQYRLIQACGQEQILSVQRGKLSKSFRELDKMMKKNNE